MVLSAALDSGYVFITFIAILTSVISAVYYLAIVKQIFFEKSDYNLSPIFNLNSFDLTKPYKKEVLQKELYTYATNEIILSNYLTITISSITLTLLLFVFFPQESISMANILALILFN